MGFYTDISYKRNILSLIGSFMVHFVIGTTYTTGNLSIYIASYLRAHGSSVTIQTLNVLFPLQVISATFSILIAPTLATKTNP